MEVLTPSEIVRELDKYIVGQAEAKRAVAIALRNRYRRRLLPAELQEEVMPKNILMIGPTGVGKTEIARRLAKLVDAPFIKVEATKFTEVGYVGRDVDSIVRDLVETSIRIVKAEKMSQVEAKAEAAAEDRILELLCPMPSKKIKYVNPFNMLFGTQGEEEQEDEAKAERVRIKAERERLREELRAGKLEDKIIEFEVDDVSNPMIEVFTGSGMEEMGVNLREVFGGLLPKRRKKKKMTVREGRKHLIQEEADKIVDMDEVISEAIQRAEQTGIIFIDEIDKIAAKTQSYGPDVSREGVQRDILPIVEGSTVMTKYGPVRTNHILFIAAGAFHISKPSDLIPELQGRFPIRVELESLTREDFKRILTEPENALTRQYTELLRTDGVNIRFTEDGIESIADMAAIVNEETENIGARRLHTIMEKVVEEISFAAPDGISGEVVIDAAFVRSKLKDIAENRDLSRYIL